MELNASRVVEVANHRPLARSTSSDGTTVNVEKTIPAERGDAGRRQITGNVTHEFLVGHDLLSFRDHVTKEP